MKTSYKFIGIFLMILSALFIPFISGCEENSDENDYVPTLISRGPANIKFINYDRSQFVLTDGWTLNIDGNTEVSRQRPSCSGFNHANVYEIEKTDFIWYKIDMMAPTTRAADKEATAVEFVAQRAECQEEPIQFVVDIDKDRDGVGAAQDPDDNDPNVR